MARVYGERKRSLCWAAFLGPGILRQHGRARRRSHPRLHPQPREGRSETGADEPVALTAALGGSKFQGPRQPPLPPLRAAPILSPRLCRGILTALTRRPWRRSLAVRGYAELAWVRAEAPPHFRPTTGRKNGGSRDLAQRHGEKPFHLNRFRENVQVGREQKERELYTSLPRRILACRSATGRRNVRIILYLFGSIAAHAGVAWGGEIFQLQNGSIPAFSKRLAISSLEGILTGTPIRSNCLFRKKLFGFGPTRINSPSLGTFVAFHMSSAPPPGKIGNRRALAAMRCLANCLHSTSAAIPAGVFSTLPNVSTYSMVTPCSIPQSRGL